jgi:asparagine N-glycosylation enzyme membrane subunit Stt3
MKSENKQHLKEIVSAFLLLGITATAAMLWGQHGLFGIMWLYFVTLTVILLRRKEDRRFGILWGLFTLTVLILYICELILSSE